MAESSLVLGTPTVFDDVRALEEGAVYIGTHSAESSSTSEPIALEAEDGANRRLSGRLAGADETTEEVEAETEPLPPMNGSPTPLRRLVLQPAIAAQPLAASDGYGTVSPMPLAPSLSTPAVEAGERGEAQPAAADSITSGTNPSALLAGAPSFASQREVLQQPVTSSQPSSPRRYGNGLLSCSSTPSPSREDPVQLAPNDAGRNRSGQCTQEDDTDIGLQFLCPICLEVCEDAVETPCCHNLFCQSCLLSEEHRIERCPICKSQLQAVDVLPNIPVRRVVADLPCACRFDGCRSKLRRRDRARHEAICEFLPVRCRYSAECGPLLRGALARHEAEECPRRPVPCPMGCGFTVSFNCLEEHLGLDCPRVLCTCEFCDAPISRADLLEHTRQHCPRAIVVCGLLEEDTQARCDCRLERRQLAEHREVCGFRAAICRHQGCNLVTTARLLASHEEVCQYRRLPCPDCGEDVRMGNLQQHLEAECPDHIVSCPFAAHGCTTLIPRRLMDEHLKQATSEHLGYVCNSLESRDVQLEIMRMEVAHMREDFAHMREDFEQRLQRMEHGDLRSSHSASFGHHSTSPVPSLPAPRITAIPAMGLESTSLGPLPPPPPPPPPPVLLPRARAVPGVHGNPSPVPSSVADSNMEQWLSVTHPAPWENWDMHGGHQPPSLRRSLPSYQTIARHHGNRMGVGGSSAGSPGMGTGYRSRNQSQLSVPPPPMPHQTTWQGRGTSHPNPAWRPDSYQPVSRVSNHDVSITGVSSVDGGNGSQPYIERTPVNEPLWSPLPSPRSPSSMPSLPPPPLRATSSGPRLAAVVELSQDTEPELEIMEDLTGVELDY